MIKVVWGVAQALIAFILLFSGGDNGLNALQNMAIMTALPFSIIILCMMVSFYKDANKERKFLGLTLSPKKHRIEEYTRPAENRGDKKSEELLNIRNTRHTNLNLKIKDYFVLKRISPLYMKILRF